MRIQLRRGTTAQWATAATILALGEPGYDVTTGTLKVGDGVTAFASLPAVTGSATITGQNLVIATAGNGIAIKSGANAKIGTAVLVAGAVTVGNTSVTANSIILLTTQVPGGVTGTPIISAKTPGVSFAISSVATDTSTVGYVIIEATP